MNTFAQIIRYMNFIEELEWRGMLHDMTPGISENLAHGMHTAYIGFDPTAPSLHIGNYVQIMLLNLFQKAGHRPIFLLGGATGRIGDPSGKDKERQLRSYEELDANLHLQKQQAQKHLIFDEGSNRALMVNNFEFYKEMLVLDFLRDVGKNLTVNYMISKESVKKRLETGISFTEFSYQLLQAYDFLYLYKNYNCTIQMGGSDQWGNITSGTEFIRRNIPGAKAFALTSPLLTKSDGRKFGKSEEGNIWLDPNLTTPYKFFQFWVNTDDADISKFLRFFSLKKREEILQIQNDLENEPREQKKLLAKELTIRIHSVEDFNSVMEVSEILFSKKSSLEKIRDLDQLSFESIANEIPTYSVSVDSIKNHLSVVDLLSNMTQISASKGDVRRSIKNNAISINKVKVSSPDLLVSSEDLLHGKYLLIENGKKNKYLIRAI